MLEAGLDASYVLDEMEVYEIEAILKNLYLKNKASWEQARLMPYIYTQAHTKQHKSLTDFLKFPWEKEETSENGVELTPEEIARREEILRARAQAMAEYLSRS